MLEVLNCVNPSPEQWEIVINGMRLFVKSEEKSDSFIEELEPDEFENCYSCDLYNKKPEFIFGESDKQLLLNLCKADDPSYKKVLQQLPIILTVKAPLSWWKQADKLPQSNNQTRCWSINYETALNIIQQRKRSKKKEWRVLINSLLENVPYLDELAKVIV